MAETAEGRAAARTERSTDGDNAEAVQCGYCGQRFAGGDLLALHRGLSHPERVTEREREAFESAYAAEDEDLRLFRLKALLALMLLYFCLLFAYSVFG